MNNLLLAPHNDDEALFASYIILRWKPKVLIITDSHIHEAKFGESRGIVARRKESEEAMKILGVEVDFLGIPDNGLYLDNLIVNLEDYGNPDGKIFAPAKQGGHKDHDTVSEAATKIFGGRVVYYSTYAKDDLTPKGQVALFPTPDEEKLKKQALVCYKTQTSLNPHHFNAVRGKPEYLNL